MNKFKKDWVCTDPSTEQYGRQLSEFIFEFKEKDKEQTAIDLTGYTNWQIEEFINSFGYTFMRKAKMQDVAKIYGKKANWIIAECIFELT